MSSLPNPFHRKQRLIRKRDFDAMYSEGSRRSVGPLLILTKPNTLDHARLGLSLPKHVGNAVIRNRIKRRCREAFRASQHELPIGVDILLTVRKHSPLPTNEYVILIKRGVVGER